MKGLKFFVLLFIVLISFNLYAYNIEKIDTKIVIRENGILEVYDTVFITNIEKSQEVFLPIVPVYDLKIKSVYEDLDYSYDFSTLKINLSDCCLLNNSVILEVIYLTDVFTYKNENIWQLNYFPIFNSYVDTFSLTFPENIKIIDISTDFRNISIKDNRFYLSLYSVTSFDVNYSYKYSFEDEGKKSFNWFLFFLFFFIFFIVSYISFKKYYRKRENEKKDILLGLNENEQKIVKVVIKENGILQKNLSRECFLPKGTVSRNLKKLEDKGYIEIKRYGVNKKVFLGKVFSKK